MHIGLLCVVSVRIFYLLFQSRWQSFSYWFIDVPSMSWMWSLRRTCLFHLWFFFLSFDRWKLWILIRSSLLFFFFLVNTFCDLFLKTFSTLIKIISLKRLLFLPLNWNVILTIMGVLNLMKLIRQLLSFCIF